MKNAYSGEICFNPNLNKAAILSAFEMSEIAILVISVTIYLRGDRDKEEIEAAAKCLTKLVYTLEEKDRKSFLELTKRSGMELIVGSEINISGKNEAEIDELKKAAAAGDLPMGVVH